MQAVVMNIDQNRHRAPESLANTMRNGAWRIFYSHHDTMGSSQEKGAVLIEAAIVAPILIISFLFLYDFALYSKALSYVTLVTRESALFLATAPGTLSTEEWENLQNDPETIQYCSAEPSATDCAQYLAHYRAALLFNTTTQANLNLNQLSITSSYNDPHVTLTVSVPLSHAFFMNEATVSKTASLRRVGS